MKKFTILESLLFKLTERIAKVNNKMKKYGDNELVVNISEKRYDNDKESPFYRHYVVDIEIEGSYKINDWEFIASCEYDTSVGKNIIKAIPGCTSIPQTYYTSTKCDHCGTERFRKYTVILQNNKTGEYRQVGKSCLKDYIGVDITGYAAYLSSFDSIEEYANIINREGLARDRQYFEVRDILCQTIARAEDRGYISKKTAENSTEFITTTASDVYHIMNESHNEYGDLLIPRYNINENHIEKANEVIEFILNKDSANDYYIHNLQTLTESKIVGNDNLGLTVSMFGYYLREKAKMEAENRERATCKSEYVGTVGEKFTFTGTPICVSSIDTAYGVMRIYKFIVGNDILIWKTGKYLDGEVEITLKGTIKNHSEFRGQRQTELTRCRVSN